MIDFEQELDKYKPVLELKDIEEELATNEDIKDIVDIVDIMMIQHRNQTD